MPRPLKKTTTKNTTTSKRSNAPRSGRCQVCGCTDEHGCAVGCEWANSSHTLCSACVEFERMAVIELGIRLVAIERQLTGLPEEIVYDEEFIHLDAQPGAMRTVKRALERRVSLVRKAIQRARKTHWRAS